MKRIILLIVTGLFLFSPVLAQKSPEGIEKISLQVLAVKGVVKWNSKELKKNDVIEIYSLKNLPSSLKYTSSSDWVNLINKKDKKVLNFYAQQKQSSDGKYLFARGSDNPVDYSVFFTKGIKYISKDKDLLSYFDRPVIFLFDSDTIVCPDLIIYKINQKNKFFLKYMIDGSFVSTLIGSTDTLILSKEKLSIIQEKVSNQGCISSFEADSMTLNYFNGITQETTQLALQNFNIYFFDDVVRGLRNIGLNNKTILSELITYFVGYDQLAIQSGLKQDGDINKWLYGEIKHVK